MKRNEQGGGASVLAAVRRLLSDERRRPVAIRYLLPMGSSLLTLLLAALPLIRFRTVGGESEAHSLFYWIHVSFFGAEGTRGAYASLAEASAGNANLPFYRAVAVTCVISAILLALGVVLTLLTSVAALYLLSTEEKTEASRKTGRILRVIYGARGMTLVPCGVKLLPFLFPHLLSYYYTALLLYDADTAFVLLDPLVWALVLFAVEIFAFLAAKDREKRARYDIFRSPAARDTTERRRRDADLEWEAAVRADAEGSDGTSSEEAEARESLNALFSDPDDGEEPTEPSQEK